MRKHRQVSPATVLTQPTWITACVYAAFAAIGAGAGLLIELLADWLVTLPWVPMQGPFELAVTIPSPWLPATGAVLGLAVALVAHHEQLTVHVTDAALTLRQKGKTQELPRDTVGTVFQDGKWLVLLDRGGGELARRESDLDPRRIATALTRHGYAWSDDDPHRSDFRPWVPETPGLSEEANAVLKARQQLLREKGSSDDAVAELREELTRLGVVVRDEKRRQYWRTSTTHHP